MTDFEHNCNCSYCKSFKPFCFEDHLVDEIKAGNAVLFIGAGVSTENPNSHKYPFYNEMLDAIKSEDHTQSFSEVAQRLCDQKDGRYKLVKLLQDRFDYIDGFADLRFSATRFFHEIATVPYISEYITTNYDRYIEDICHAKPFAYDTDIRFWNSAKRRALKIHGTIDDYSSLVASTEDYQQCEDDLQKSLIGGKLKELLATKTCIFVGYSLRDEDFLAIQKYVSNALGDFHKSHYVISPNPITGELPKGFDHICTDGAYFFHRLKLHLADTHCQIPDTAYDEVANELDRITDVHHELFDRFPMQRYPQTVILACYQDGVIHALRRIIDMRGAGEYSDECRVKRMIQNYEEIISDYRKKRRYEDIAYFQGYQNGLIFLLLSKERESFEWIPDYYFPGIDEFDSEDLETDMAMLPETHKSAFKRCQRIVREFPESEEIVFQRLPFG